METPEQRQWHHSGVFMVNFTPFSTASIVNFEQVNANWVLMSKHLLKVNTNITW